MQSINLYLFLLFNAPAATGDLYVSVLAVILATWLIWLLPLLLVCGWFWCDHDGKRDLVAAASSGVLALAAAAFIGWQWPQPRPFMLGLGRMLIDHAPDASLPSDHLTLWWAVALSLAFSPRFRTIGLLLSIVGLPMAWARIYAGVHFPLDMLAALLVAWSAAMLLSATGQRAVAAMTAALQRLQRRLGIGL